MKLQIMKDLLPYGIGVNSSDTVVSRNAINEFFLQAVLNVYNEIEHYAVTFAAPQSYEALQLCSHEELAAFAEEQKCRYYYTNDLEVNAYFCYCLYNKNTNSSVGLDAIIKYVFNSLDVTGEPYYADQDPHCYKILCTGDVATSILTTEIISRIHENINQLVSVTEKWNGLVIRDEEALEVNTAGTTTSACRVCRVPVRMLNVQ